MNEEEKRRFDEKRGRNESGQIYERMGFRSVAVILVAGSGWLGPAMGFSYGPCSCFSKYYTSPSIIQYFSS